jgi:hypothetical protein
VLNVVVAFGNRITNGIAIVVFVKFNNGSNNVLFMVLFICQHFLFIVVSNKNNALSPGLSILLYFV